MAANPFDLTKKKTGGPDSQYLKKVYSQDEIKDALADYIQIPKAYWGRIPFNTHIRYFKLGGEFMPGGFILNAKCKIKSTEDGNELDGMRLQNGFNPSNHGYVSWSVAFDKTEKIYAKMSATEAYLFDMITDLKTNMITLNENMMRLSSAIKGKQ